MISLAVVADGPTENITFENTGAYPGKYVNQKKKTAFTPYNSSKLRDEHMNGKRVYQIFATEVATDLTNMSNTQFYLAFYNSYSYFLRFQEFT